MRLLLISFLLSHFSNGQGQDYEIYQPRELDLSNMSQEEHWRIYTKSLIEAVKVFSGFYKDKDLQYSRDIQRNKTKPEVANSDIDDPEPETTTTTTTTTEKPKINPQQLFKECPHSNVCSRTTCGQPNRQRRIVGGIETRPNEYPWMVELQVQSRRGAKFVHHCGASLISDVHVVTAAHCVVGSRKRNYRYRVILGDHNRLRKYEGPDEQVVRVAQVIPHHRYKEDSTMFADIAILKLARRISFTSTIRPVCLPQRTDINFEDEVGKVLGWGATAYGRPSIGVLRELDAPIIPLEVCRRRSGYTRIYRSMICAGFLAGGRDSCTGDSGGPLTVLDSSTKKHVLAGIVSHGSGCAKRNHPGIYTRVTSFLLWLNHNTKDGCFCS